MKMWFRNYLLIEILEILNIGEDFGTEIRN